MIRTLKPLASSPSPRPARRVADWPTLLFALIEARRAQPFEWGRHDCCLFAADGILAQTGVDPASPLFRGQYHDALGAARLVRKHGGIAQLADKFLGAFNYPVVPVLMAQRGDILLMDKVEGDGAAMGCALGLCIGGEGAFVGGAGLVFHPVAICRRAWRVG